MYFCSVYFLDKDVVRTDRVHPYYENDSSSHLEILNDILMTYCQFNFDLGKLTFDIGKLYKVFKFWPIVH